MDICVYLRNRKAEINIWEKLLKLWFASRKKKTLVYNRIIIKTDNKNKIINISFYSL